MTDSLDLSQFHETFFDEATELLQDMEDQLLALDQSNPDQESMNAIFRAVHSIKGGSGTFGTFEVLTNTAHEMETVMDSIRKGNLPLNDAGVNVLLLGKDVLGAQLQAYRSGGEPDRGAQRDFLERLNSFSESPDTAASQGAKLRITLDPVSQADAKSLQIELAILGQVLAHHEDGPRHQFELATEVSREDILAVCGFILDEDQILIESIEGPPAQRVGAPSLEASTSPAVVGAKTKSVADAAGAPRESSSIRVAVDKVDQIIDSVGEIVITQSMLMQSMRELDPIEHAGIFDQVQRLEHNIHTLQESAMSMRMMPMDYVFGRFPRVVRETATSLNKKVNLVMRGQATELDKGMIEKLVDPLTHLVRNSMDHGIELPEVRVAAGKPQAGTITLSAAHEAGNIVIEVSDDGAGLNRDRILAKASEKGIEVGADACDESVWQLIMAPGFSTAQAVTSISGRGVGMDVVQKNIQQMGGRIGISSREGFGSSFRIVLPLTLAILDGMALMVKGQRFILSINHIAECLQADASMITRVAANGQTLLHLRDEYLPVLDLAQCLGLQTSIEDCEPEAAQTLLIAHVERRRFALRVQALLGQSQVVVKSLEAHYQHVPYASGATVLGDGKVAIILNASFLANCMGTAPPSFVPTI